MAETAVYNLPYQGVNDAPNGPTLGQELAEAVETELVRIDTDVADLAAGIWQTYAPTWASTGTQPVRNNGVITGRYRQVGKTVTVAVRVLAGSTTTYGTGGYSISLPVTAATNVACIGSAYCRDASATSAGHLPAIAVIDTAAPTVAVFFNVNSQVSNTSPFTWANGDSLSFTITYEAA